ncbi:hypothetical protein M2284_003653 [Rhodococcus sp. LBL1]|uniref:Uncharacterized protein n=1 Tax=Prescottella agglutinans TaxID=1644129 RepID=A0ABT6M7K0_9NOCA|nr:hypothetical protein [Prescottella agglutinans]MDH6279905.1 hypothetical protein [Prescottella agglutinans]MDH6679431.1 hypothetical protein [Rhodococcus sp. LBL1]MDH6685430.1 hypothetical protein [Rhodococcus sp. LBL2]
MTEFNSRVVTEFRANGGHLDSFGFGTNLALVRSLGARSGIDRTPPRGRYRSSALCAVL